MQPFARIPEHERAVDGTFETTSSHLSPYIPVLDVYSPFGVHTNTCIVRAHGTQMLAQTFTRATLYLELVNIHIYIYRSKTTTKGSRCAVQVTMATARCGRRPRSGSARRFRSRKGSGCSSIPFRRKLSQVHCSIIIIIIMPSHGAAVNTTIIYIYYIYLKGSAVVYDCCGSIGSCKWGSGSDTSLKPLLRDLRIGRGVLPGTDDFATVLYGCSNL